MTSCDGTDTTNQPWRMIGAFAKYYDGLMSVMNYTVLQLYDPSKTYYVFLSCGNDDGFTPMRFYIDASDTGATTYYSNLPTDISKTNIALGSTPTTIGSFSLSIEGTDSHYTNIQLTKGVCNLNFELELGNTYKPGSNTDDWYKWHFISVQPPQCYLCTNCGLFGDFQTRVGHASIIDCHGDRIVYNADRYFYDDHGWTYELSHFNAHCLGAPTIAPPTPKPTDLPTPEPPQSRFPAAKVRGKILGEDSGSDEATECESGSQQQQDSELACQEARDKLDICCRNLGGGFCTNLQYGCEFDTCLEILYENFYFYR